MVTFCVLFVLLFFEPLLICGRPYECYTTFPCPMTNPVSRPAWSCDMSNYGLKCQAPTSTCEPEPEPAPEKDKKEKKKKKKKKKKDEEEEEEEWITTTFFTKLFAIPGAIADSVINSEAIV